MSSRNNLLDRFANNENDDNGAPDEVQQNYIIIAVIHIPVVVIIITERPIPLGEQATDEPINNLQDLTNEQINEAIQYPPDQLEATILILCWLILILCASHFVQYLPLIILVIIAYRELTSNTRSRRTLHASRSPNEYFIPSRRNDESGDEDNA